MKYFDLKKNGPDILPHFNMLSVVLA